MHDVGRVCMMRGGCRVCMMLVGCATVHDAGRVRRVCMMLVECIGNA